MLRRVVLVLIPVALLVSACSGGDTGTSTTAASATTAAADAGAEIVISGFSFGEAISVAVGQPVTVRNDDATAHTWTSDDGLFDSGTLAQGEEFTFTFDEPGEFSFHCEIHPSMVGTITVTG